MRIDDTPSGTFRPIAPRAEGPQDPAPVRPRAERPSAQPAPERPRRDTVEFSDTARTLARTEDREPVRPTLSAERREAIRQRVLEGAYNQLDLVDQVARRLLRSGDL